MPSKLNARLLLALTTLIACQSTFAEKKNILLIITDDQSPFTLSAYGNTVCETPNLDKLAASGMVLDRAYHMGSMSGAVCTPSRTMVMTGRTLWHLPNFPTKKPNKKQNKEAPRPDTKTQQDAQEIINNTLPAVFNRAGYETFRTCKQGNSFGPANKLFTTVRDQTNRGATDQNGSQWHGRQALEFLDTYLESKNEKPFLMFLGFSHPHDERTGREDLNEKYGAFNTKTPPIEFKPKAPALPKNWLPAHPFDHGHPGLRDETKVPGVLTSRTEATIRNELGREYACIENIDQQIGPILAKLEEAGELKNTYIIFTSDHGIAVGRHGLTGKQNLYEHTWRVPFLASGPGIEASSRAPGNCYLLDILPTICDLAEVAIPETAQGKSLKPVLLGKKEVVREVLYGAYCGGTKPGMRSVRKGDWKLIKYDVLDGKVRETQLFNLKENPDEFLIEHHSAKVVAATDNKPSAQQVNLAEDPRYANKLAEMEALLLNEMIRLDDPYRLWNQKEK